MHSPQMNPPGQKNEAPVTPVQRGLPEAAGLGHVGQLGKIHHLQKTLGNRHFAQLVRSQLPQKPPETPVMAPPQPPVVQRQIKYIRRNADATMDEVDKTQTDRWLRSFKETAGQPLSALPSYEAFSHSPHVKIHIDVTNTSPDYMNQLKTLLSANAVEYRKTHDKELMTPEACRRLAPAVLVVSTVTFVSDLGDQTLFFRDQDVTMEQAQRLSPQRAEAVYQLVQQAKVQIERVLAVMTQLTASRAMSPDVENLKATLSRLLNTTPDNLAGVLPHLNNLFQLMHHRLSAQELEISTMDLITTTNEPRTKGNSRNKETGTWILNQYDKPPNFTAWTNWLASKSNFRDRSDSRDRSDFGGTIELRINTEHLHTRAYQSELLNTLIHELSHAAASTQDFAYVNDQEKYGKLTTMEYLGNADTIAAIVSELAPPPLASALPETSAASGMAPLPARAAGSSAISSPATAWDGDTQWTSPTAAAKDFNEKKTSAPDIKTIKKNILAMEAAYPNDTFLKGAIDDMLKELNIKWEILQDEFGFTDPREERISMLMI